MKDSSRKACMSRLLLAFGIPVGSAVALSGCLSVPFEVTGDVLEAGFGAAGSVAEAPFQVLGSAADGLDASLGSKHVEEFELHSDAEGLAAIRAETLNGSIRASRAEGEDVLIRVRKETRSRSMERAGELSRQIAVNAERDGDFLLVRCEKPRDVADRNVSVSYEIELPRDFDLDLNTSNGKIEVTDVNGTLELKTSNGPVYARNGTVDVRIRTTNGKVELTNLSGRFHVETSNGPIHAHLGAIDGESAFTTSNGGVDVAAPHGIAPIDIQTNNGPIRLAVPGFAGGRLDAKTSNGRVRSDFPVMVYEYRQSELKGDFGGGGPVEIHLRTSNGSIHLANAAGSEA